MGQEIHTHCVWIKESTHTVCGFHICPTVLFLTELQLLFYLLYYSACKNLYEPSKSFLKEVSRTQLFCYWIRLKKLVYKHVYNLVSAFTPEIPGGGGSIPTLTYIRPKNPTGIGLIQRKKTELFSGGLAQLELINFGWPPPLLF